MLAGPGECCHCGLPEGHLKWGRSFQSDRKGLVCFDIEPPKLLFFRRDRGHPVWDPSSQKFINVPNLMMTLTLAPASIFRSASMENCL
jgi:hypothetical protein